MKTFRRDRASYTRTLEAICGRLDTQPDASIIWIHPFAHIKCNSLFCVTSLWAVGSYARGALDCGDLDLLAEIVMVDGPPPPEYEVAKEFFKFRKGVSLHIGTPHQNTSNTQFPEARLIWHGPGCDWQAAIDAITPDPSAGHYERATDRIPFQPNQLRCDIEAFEELLSLEEQKIIQWKFSPIDLAVNVEPLSQDEQELSQVVTFRCGRKTRQLLPHLIAYLRTADGWSKPYLRANFDRSMIGIGGSQILVRGRYATANVRRVDELGVRSLRASNPSFERHGFAATPAWGYGALRAPHPRAGVAQLAARWTPSSPHCHVGQRDNL